MKKNIFLIQKNEKKMYLSYNIHYKLSNDTKIESFDDILIKSWVFNSNMSKIGNIQIYAKWWFSEKMWLKINSLALHYI